MNWIGKYVSVWQSRIVLGLAFFGAVIVGLWPDHDRAIDAPKLVACILTGVAWLTAELASAVTKASNHDIALFERINNVMNDGALTFLLEHDFANDFHVRQTEPINTIAVWHGPNYIFNDRTIQRRWQTLFDKILDLSNTYGTNLVNSEHSVERMTAWLLGFPRNAQPPEAHADVKELNDKASEVYREFSEFAPFVRKRLDL